MFGRKKKMNKKVELVSPVDGTLIAIEEVNDPVFSTKMMGDGFAVSSTGDTIYACGDATVAMLFPSNHAVGLVMEDGLEVLLHVGIDTVNENGKGFTCLCAANTSVKKGDPLLRMDRAYLSEKGYDLTVIAIFTNKESYQTFERMDKQAVIGGQDGVVTYTI